MSLRPAMFLPGLSFGVKADLIAVDVADTRTPISDPARTPSASFFYFDQSFKIFQTETVFVEGVYPDPFQNEIFFGNRLPAKREPNFRMSLKNSLDPSSKLIMTLVCFVGIYPDP